MTYVNLINNESFHQKASARLFFLLTRQNQNLSKDGADIYKNGVDDYVSGKSVIRHIILNSN